MLTPDHSIIKGQYRKVMCMDDLKIHNILVFYLEVMASGLISLFVIT